METRDIRLVFNYTTRIAKSYNLRPEITKSKGIPIKGIPSLLDQLKSREENAADAEHLDYMKTGLSIYSLPLITVPDILEGKHKTSTIITNSHETDTVNDESESTNDNKAEDTPEENIEEPTVVEEKKSKKNKKNKKEETENGEEKASKKDKPKGITKLEKMKEKLHKKK